jgi:pseudaminic acid synthase
MKNDPNIIKIGNRLIGEDRPVFIIAELSGNHLQDYNLAVKTIKAMKKAGADAVKLQTYTADTITIDCDKKHFQITQGTIWDGTTLHKLYQQAHTPWEWQPKLKKLADELGIILFSSPFDPSSIDFLEKMNVPAYKVASLEIGDHGLIEAMARTGKPIIISTGVATSEDITEAIRVCRKAGNEQVAILKCTSAYPTPMEELNLKTIPDIAQKFKVVAGLSDHTMGSTITVAAVALGAKIIEKHFILDRKLGGPDGSFSMEPLEFRQMVDQIRDVEKALGKVNYELTPKAKKSRQHSRSLFVVADIKKGEKFTTENVRSIRPGFGLAPKFINDVIGAQAKRNIKRGDPLKKQDYQWNT